MTDDTRDKARDVIAQTVRIELAGYRYDPMGQWSESDADAVLAALEAAGLVIVQVARKGELSLQCQKCHGWKRVPRYNIEPCSCQEANHDAE